MHFIAQKALEDFLDYPELIAALKTAFCSAYTVPLRQHYDYKNPQEQIDSTLLLMPAWKNGAFLGVKLVTVSPNNYRHNLPSIQGVYTLFDAHKGNPLLQLDAPTLTNIRTAAASALASQFLSRTNSTSLLMVGTGALAPYLIRAHASVRPIKEVYIWGRNHEKAKMLAANLHDLEMQIAPVEELNAILPLVDIISCATLSKSPLIHGKHLVAGQHLDLVGSFKPNMREADDDAIQDAALFVDTLEGAPKESGDIFLPIQKGVISLQDIKGDLFALCRGDIKGRTDSNEITLFKSVGHALEDLAAAELVYKKWRSAKNEDILQ